MKRTLKGGGETVTSKLNVHFLFVCIYSHTLLRRLVMWARYCDVRVFARILKRMSVVNSVLPLTNLCTGLVPEYLVAIATIENVVQAFTVCKTEVVVTARQPSFPLSVVSSSLQPSCCFSFTMIHHPCKLSLSTTATHSWHMM